MEAIALRGLTAAFGSSALTATGAETVHDTTIALNFSIGGKAYTKSATNVDAVTPTTDHATGAAFKALTGTTTGGEACLFVWCYNSSGAPKVVQGEIVATDAAGNVAINPEFPLIPGDVCPFAYQLVKQYGSASTFVFGTTNWSGATSSAIVNVCTLPVRL